MLRLKISNSTFIYFLSLILISAVSYQANAIPLLDDIGYTSLQNELGTSTPDGTGVSVSLIEAFTSPPSPAPGCSSSNLSSCQYLPDTSIKTYNDKSAGLGFSTSFSGHATGSANSFYGSSSTSPGISNIDVYAAGHWLAGGYLNTGTTTTPLTSSTRVSSHSYVGSAGSTGTDNLELLQRIDFLADKDDHILAVAMNNGSSNQPLNASAYNVIAVGRTDGNHPRGSVDVNPGAGLYNSTLRTRPDIVVPVPFTSSATPRVASAAALLVSYGKDQGMTKSNGSNTNRNGDTIYHAETSEVIKASLMAGASRSTSNTSSTANITDYRSTGNETSNGLDTRYGAGQLNIDNSYSILESGEQDAGTVSGTGFDYEATFAGDDIASYFFTNSDDEAWFTASLVWDVAFDDGENNFTSSVANLFDLDLYLYSVSSGIDTLVASSVSDIDNTENIWLQLDAAEYRLDVVSDGAFDQDYGLAWQTSPVPVPAAIWFFASSMITLLTFRRKT